ncbi:S8 family peptidase [Bdellovibrionota bacterium FG-1]
MRRAVKAGIATTLILGSLVSFGFTHPEPSIGKSLLKEALQNTVKIPSFKNWGLVNTEARSHISAVEAWKLEEGSRQVVVAVIDTGIDANHKDLNVNIWHDPNQKHSQVYGWNFVNDKANPVDDHGHGTHVAGIIGAVADPLSGVSGVAHRVSIMAVKYYSDANPGPVNLRNTIRAINYAIDHGAQIINYSGGGPEFSEDEYLALKRAESKDILVVSAAGNEHQNTDLTENRYFPAAYRLSNMISVAATDIHNNLLPSSNWGKQFVDVAAPGENIFSTLPGNRYGYMSGTSQATAFVSGMAALLLSQNPTLKPAEIKKIIKGSVDRFPQLAGKLVTGGRVNAYSALLAARNPRLRDTVVASRHPVSLMNALTPAPSAE